MKGRDDQDGEQDRPWKNHQQILIDGVGDVLQDFGQPCDRDGFGVPVFRWAVIDDVLEVIQERREIFPVSCYGGVVMHADDDGRRVPNAVAVHVVGVVSITVAVNGGVHVVRILDQRVESTV